MDANWVDATVVVEGLVRSVDPTGLLTDAHSVVEATIRDAETAMGHFKYNGPGWYEYDDHIMLVVPCSYQSRLDGAQHFLFFRYLDTATIDAMRWAAQAPVHKKATRPSEETSGVAESFRDVSCHHIVPSFWPEEGHEGLPPKSARRPIKGGHEAR